ncbi:MAG: hypothetical protein J5633_04415 [Oscillospiraceae bacterium]|nr:hypothetical protein [Oscillospiraceae bacterium]
MGKFKCPHCGHIQNRDGVCEGCDISKVLPVNNKPKFIKGVRYKCDFCNHRFKAYFDECPKCGKGKLIPQYKNHKQFKKAYRVSKFILSLLLIMLIIGTAFVLRTFFPDTADSISNSISTRMEELKLRLDAYAKNSTTNYQQSTNTAISKEEYINRCQPVDYKSVARKPNDYKNMYVTFRGKVIQVIEGNTVYLRINQDSDDIWSNDTWFVEYKPSPNEIRILEDDTITVFGVCTGLYTYKALLGQQVTIPSMTMKYYELEE